MTLRNLIKEASLIKDELQDKEIVIMTENGSLVKPKIKFVPKSMLNPILDAEHIDKIIITTAD